VEAVLDTEPIEPLGESLAAAVHDDDGAIARHRGDLAENAPLLGDRRPAQLDDERASSRGHVLYSEFSVT
jgi:hypothetical protein